MPTSSHPLGANSHLSATPSLCQCIFPATQWTRLGKWPSSDANMAKSCFRQTEFPTKFWLGCMNAGPRQRRRQEGTAVRNLGHITKLWNCGHFWIQFYLLCPMSVCKTEKKAGPKETQWGPAKTDLLIPGSIYIPRKWESYNNPELVNIIYFLHIEFKILWWLYLYRSLLTTLRLTEKHLQILMDMIQKEISATHSAERVVRQL